jgi:hypothetical protein
MLNELQTAKMASLGNFEKSFYLNNEIAYWNIKLQKDFLVYGGNTKARQIEQVPPLDPWMFQFVERATR